MSKLYDFGFFNIQFDTKAVDENGNHRRTNFNNLHLNIKGKSLFASAENGSGKTSIFRLLKSQFVPINKAASDNTSASILNYFKYTQGAYPAVVWSDFISNGDADKHTMIITYNQLESEINLNQLDNFLPSEALNRYGIVINYNAKDNPAPTQNNFGIMPKLGLINKDAAGAYIPCAIEDIKKKLSDNAKNLKEFDPQIDICFAKSLNSPSNVSAFHDAMLTQAYAPNDAEIWKNIYTRVLNSEGGIINIFFDTKSDNSTKIKKASEIVSDLFFPTIIAQSGRENNFKEIKESINSFFMGKFEHSESYKKLQSLQTIQKKLEQLDTEAYREKLNQYRHDKDQEYQLKSKLLYTKDLLASELTSFQDQLSQNENQLLQAKYATYFLAKRDKQQAYNESQSKTIEAAKVALQNRRMWLSLNRKENTQKLNDASSELEFLKKEKQKLEKQNSQSDEQQTIEVLKAKLKKYYSTNKDNLFLKIENQNKEEQRLQKKRNELVSLQKKQQDQRTKLYSQKDSLQKEVDKLTSETQGYTEQNLNDQKVDTQASIKELTQTIAKLEQTISDNKDKIEAFSKEIAEKNKQRIALSEEKVKKEQDFEELTQNRKNVLQILDDYRNILQLPDTASKNEIINRFGLSLDKNETNRRVYLSKELSLNKQIDNLKNKTIIDIPEVVKDFIRTNNIESTTGFEYLSKLKPQEAKDYIAKYSYLPFALLVNDEDFEKFSQFKEITGIESLLVVNKDKLTKFRDNNIMLIGNFDLDYIDNYEDKVKELSNDFEQIKKKGRNLQTEYKNLTSAKEKVATIYVSESQVNDAQEAVAKISEELAQVSTELKKLNNLTTQLTVDNKNLNQQINQSESNLQEAKVKLTNLETISQKLQELLNKRPHLESIKQKFIEISDEFEKTSQTLNDIANSIGKLQVDKGRNDDQLKAVNKELTTYRDADLTLINDKDMIKFSAQAAKSELDRLVNKLTSDSRVLELKMQQANEKIANLNKERDEFEEKYRTDTESYKKYVEQDDIFSEKNLDLYSLDTLDSKFSSLNRNFIRQEANTEAEEKDLQVANNKLNKFMEDNPEIDTTFEITDLYQSVIEAQASVRSLNEEIRKLEKDCVKIERLQDKIQSIVKYTIGLVKDKILILKKQYSSQKELVTDNHQLIKSLIAKVEDLSNKNNEIRENIYKTTLKEWKKLKLDKEDFGNIPRVTTDKIRDNLNKDLDNVGNVSLITKEQMSKSIFEKVVKLLKNRVEAQIMGLEKAYPALKASQKTIITLILSLAHALQDGINEISKNSSVKLDRFSKAERLVKVIMPRNIPDLDNTETLAKKYNEINEQLDYLYDKFKKIVSQKHLNLKNSDDKSEARRILRQFINKNINYTTLYRWGYGNALDHINFKVLNPYSTTKAQYLKWEGNNGDTVGSASGAQRLTISLCMLIPLLRYLSADRDYTDSAINDEQLELFSTSKKNKGIYLPVDNFTANATKEELLAGVLEFAEKADIQIVSLNQVSATNISDDFHATMSLSNDMESRIALVDLKLIPTNNVDFLTMNFVDEKVD